MALQNISYIVLYVTVSFMDEEPVVCLASHGVSTKKIVVCGERKLNDVIASLGESAFAGLVTDALLVQIFDTEFNKYIDMDETTVLQQHSELKLEIVKQSTVPAQTEGDKGAEYMLSASTSTLQSSAAHEPGPNMLTREYELPPTPVDIAEGVKGVKRGDVPEHLRRRIVDWMFYDMASYTMYAGKMCKPAAQQLVRRYPQLGDTALDGSGSWYMSLRNKGKNLRRMMSGFPEIDAARAKARKKSNKATAASTNAGTPGAFLKTIRRGHVQPSTPGMLGLGEDDATISGHMTLMQKELRKHDYSKEKVKLAMECTFKVRRAWIESGNISVQEIIDKYPALQTDTEIRNEFQRLTNVDADAALLRFIKASGHKILDMAYNKKSARAEIKRMKEHMDTLQEEQQKYYFAVSVLRFLPSLVKENWHRWLTELDPDQEVYTYPTVTYAGCDLASSDSISVCVEGLHFDAPDVTSAVSLQMAMYWTFNIRYSFCSQQTLSLLEHMMGIAYTPLNTLALRAQTKILSA
ncbi:uncharacterized protein LOC135378750 [Ornithodoros turicata]|uniref:uncharacterized protein LOC135378750 n=1 Tax=Ornithodoros turicata TaxID=34597 RepID=UPI003138D716